MPSKLITGLCLAAVALFASETRVQLKDLPAAVQQTVKEQSKSGSLHGLAKEVEHGKTFYEAETIVDGKSRDILIDAGGRVVEVEQETALQSVPDAVQKTLKAAAGSGRILKVETVTKGSVATYEAVIQKSGKKSEVAVNADGTVKK